MDCEPPYHSSSPSRGLDAPLMDGMEAGCDNDDNGNSDNYTDDEAELFDIDD